MKKITILIADHYKLFREALVSILNADERFSVVADTADFEEAISLLKSIQADVIIIDINLPGLQDADAIARSSKSSPASRILLISLDEEPVYARKLLQTGVMGYVTKSSSREDLLKAIIEVFNGKEFFPMGKG